MPSSPPPSPPTPLTEAARTYLAALRAYAALPLAPLPAGAVDEPLVALRRQFEALTREELDAVHAHLATPSSPAPDRLPA